MAKIEHISFSYQQREELSESLLNLNLDGFTRETEDTLNILLDSKEVQEQITYFFLSQRVFEEPSRMIVLKKYLEKVNTSFDRWIVDENFSVKLMIILKLVQKPYLEFPEIKDVLQELEKKLELYLVSQEQALLEQVKKNFVSRQFSETTTAYSCLHDYPEDELWRLYVDGKYQIIPHAFGWFKFEEREPGCLSSMHKTFKKALLINEPLSIKVIDELHKAVVGSVMSITEKNMRDRSNVCASFLDYTLLGLYEILVKQKDENLSYRTGGEYDYMDSNLFIGTEKKFYRFIQATFLLLGNEKIKEKMQFILSRYHHKILSEDRFEKFMAIIELCSSLVRLHPYSDGNTRTFITILLNRELLKNHFPCTILKDPNWFDNFHQLELAQEVFEGMDAFNYVKEKRLYPGAPLHYTTESLKSFIERSKNSRYLNVIDEGFDFESAADLSHKPQLS